MQFGGRYRLSGNRLLVWQALNDTGVLKKVIPGCQQIEWTSPERLDVAVKVNLGVMHPVFTGELELGDVVPAESYTLSGRGHGRLLGMAQGVARVRLSDLGDQTLLEFTAEGGASNQLMALGRPLIGGSVQKVIDGFFERFADAIEVELTVLEPTRRDE